MNNNNNMNNNNGNAPRAMTLAERKAIDAKGNTQANIQKINQMDTMISRQNDPGQNFDPGLNNNNNNNNNNNVDNMNANIDNNSNNNMNRDEMDLRF